MYNKHEGFLIHYKVQSGRMQWVLQCVYSTSWWQRRRRTSPHPETKHNTLKLAFHHKIKRNMFTKLASRDSDVSLDAIFKLAICLELSSKRSSVFSTRPSQEEIISEKNCMWKMFSLKPRTCNSCLISVWKTNLGFLSSSFVTVSVVKIKFTPNHSSFQCYMTDLLVECHSLTKSSLNIDKFLI